MKKVQLLMGRKHGALGVSAFYQLAAALAAAGESVKLAAPSMRDMAVVLQGVKDAADRPKPGAWFEKFTKKKKR